MESPHTGGDHKILSIMLAENSVPLENSQSLRSSIGDRNLSNMIDCASNLNGERAGSHDDAGKGSDREDVGKHDETVTLVMIRELSVRIPFQELVGRRNYKYSFL